MATQGHIPVSSNFDRRSPIPMDPSLYRDDIADRDAIPSWQRYPNMAIDILNSTDMYRLILGTVDMDINNNANWVLSGMVSGNYYTKTELDGGQLDNRYYTETEINTILADYYTSSQVDTLLTNYYTKTNLQTSGQSQIHWDNLTNVPALTTAVWGNITGTLSNQTDLSNALGDKENVFAKNTGFNLPLGITSNTVAEGNHTHFELHQPNGTNPFVYTDNGGNLHVDGPIIQSGLNYEIHTEQVYQALDLIITRDGAVAGLGAGEYTGIQATLYDGANNGQLVFDNTGVARVGDIGGLQPLATREESPTDGYYAKWSTLNQRFETAAIASNRIENAVTTSYLEFGNGGVDAHLTGYSTDTLSTTIFRLDSATIGPAFGVNAQGSIFIDNKRMLSVLDDNIMVGDTISTDVKKLNADRNTGIGISTLFDLTTGDDNVGIGYFAMTNMAGGSDNIGIGSNALLNVTATNGHVAIGYNAGRIAVGGNTVNIGFESQGGSTGSVSIGANAGKASTSIYSTVIGYNAGSSSSLSGRENIFIGAYSGRAVQTGYGNIFLGSFSGYYETDNNTLIVSNLDNTEQVNEATARTKALLYGIMSTTTANQVLGINAKVGIGITAPSEKLHVSGNVKATDFLLASDERLKGDIKDLNSSVDGLKPKSFIYKETGKAAYGFVAQDLIKEYPDLVNGTGKTKEDGEIDYYSIKQNSIIAINTLEIQRLKVDNKGLKERLSKIEELLNI